MVDSQCKKRKARSTRKLEESLGGYEHAHKWLSVSALDAYPLDGGPRTQNGELTAEAVRSSLPGVGLIRGVHWGQFNRHGISEFTTVHDQVHLE